MFKILIFIFFISIFNVRGDSNYVSVLIGDGKGNIIYEENMYLLHPFASVTKLMTGLIVIEEVEKGNFSLDEQVLIRPQSALIGGSRIELYWGSYMTLRDLLYASLMHSANNATYALAEHIGGSVDKFVEKMNEKAKELNMKDTVYHTPAGLPPSMNGGKGTDVGTVEDIYKLSVYALKNKILMDIVGRRTYIIDNSKEKVRIFNRNPLFGMFNNITGLKTGHHTEAGYNMTLSFKENNEDYIIVLFGAETENARKFELVSIVNNFSKEEYTAKYQEKKNKLEEENDYIANYIVNSLFGTLKEVNKGLVANYKKVELSEKKVEVKEKESSNKILKDKNKEEVKEIKKPKTKLSKEEEYIYIDTEFESSNQRFYREEDYKVKIIK